MRAVGSLSFLAVGSLLIAAALAWWLLQPDRATAAGRGHTLTVHCAAGIKGPVSEIAKAYEAESGNRVELTFGGSGTLLSALRVRAHGDLYIAGDDSYVADAKQRGIVKEELAMATMRPVIAVRRGNPKSIRGYADLLRGDVRAGLGNPKAAAVGRLAKRVAAELGFEEQLFAQAAVLKPTVNDLGNDLKIGAIDAAVIWDATARQYEDFDIVADPSLGKHVRQVTLGVLAASQQPQAALHFARFLTARDRGLPVFSRHGFTPVEGDAWSDFPQLRLMAGAMLRPAIDATVHAFEAREGVRVDVVYDGCGILVSQMKVGSIPDAYFSCDESFLTQVAGEFRDGTKVSANEIVMLVPKGNPKSISRLDDLLREGVRVGLGHPQKSALGALTVSLLTRTRHYGRLKKSNHIAVESATGDLLVNQIVAGSLDVVLVYRSNAAHVLDRCDVVKIPDAAAMATQPFAIAKQSAHPRLLQRLLDAIQCEASQRRFRELGFRVEKR